MTTAAEAREYRAEREPADVREARLAYQRTYRRRQLGNSPPRYCPSLCECCEEQLIFEGGSGSERAYSEHNHTTGEWRGWVCGKCNNLIGRIEHGKLVPFERAKVAIGFMHRGGRLPASCRQ